MKTSHATTNKKQSPFSFSRVTLRPFPPISTATPLPKRQAGTSRFQKRSEWRANGAKIIIHQGKIGFSPLFAQNFGLIRIFQTLRKKEKANNLRTLGPSSPIAGSWSDASTTVGLDINLIQKNGGEMK